jgi:hypothetical protein
VRAQERTQSALDRLEVRGYNPCEHTTGLHRALPAYLQQRIIAGFSHHDANPAAAAATAQHNRHSGRRITQSSRTAAAAEAPPGRCCLGTAADTDPIESSRPAAPPSIKATHAQPLFQSARTPASCIRHGSQAQPQGRQCRAAPADLEVAGRRRRPPPHQMPAAAAAAPRGARAQAKKPLTVRRIITKR